MNQHVLIILVAAVGIIVVGLGIMFVQGSRRKRSQELQERFGPEYDRAVAEQGSPSRAEKALEGRLERSRKIAIRPLTPENRERFAEAWRTVQAHFVDSPGKAVTEADQLLDTLMSQRGYTVGDFEQQAADLSVDHPQVIENYRRAHKVAERHRRAQASTEDLREAIIEYRVLYDELLGASSLTPNEVNYESETRRS